MKRSHLVILTVFLVLLLDQCLKIWVKTNMRFGEEIAIFGLDWARLHFVENNGMAFGLEFGGKIGKLALSLFRVFAVGLLIYLIRGFIKAREPKGLIIFFSMILAGAIGNILDSMFYGLIFSKTTYGQIATMWPEGGGYAPFLFGHVVDMFYFPLIDTNWPEWMPGLGGKRFQFFRPVFNGADAAISVGVVGIIMFYGSFLGTKKKENAQQPAKVSQSMISNSEDISSPT